MTTAMTTARDDPGAVSHRAPARVGFIGLGDQGLPMATAIAKKGHELHVWARRPASLDALTVPSTAHETLRSLATAVDIVALCVSTDEDVIRIVRDDLAPALQRGGIVVNHGTGTPRNAQRLAHLCTPFGVDVIDAPVSGGRPAAEARTLTVFAGGHSTAVAAAKPVFDSFASDVIHLGGAGAGQMAKLFNNALLMLNQAAIADVLELADRVGMPTPDLVDALLLGSADSRALRLMNTMVTPETVSHLSQVEALDMELFDRAMRDAGVSADTTTSRGLSGAHRLTEVIDRLNP